MLALTLPHLRVAALGHALLLGACGSDGRDEMIAASEGATTGGSGAADTAPTDPGTLGDADAGDGPKLDVGAGTGGADDGGGPPDPSTCNGAAMIQSNVGCEFWAVDLPNGWWVEPGSPSSPEAAQFAVAIANTSDSDAVFVEFFEGSSDTPVATGTVDPTTAELFELPRLDIPWWENNRDGQAYRVETDRPVTAYQFNPLDQTTGPWSADASLLFPTHGLGQDYAAFTGDAWTYAIHAAGAFVSVVATRDDTTLDVFVTNVVKSGLTEDIVLQRGQVYTVLSESCGLPVCGAGVGNLSGTRVAASKPVAVFSGNVSSFEPQTGIETCCADHLEQQLAPLDAWGRAYVASPVTNPSSPAQDALSGFRIMSGFDGVELAYDPAPPAGAPTNLDAYAAVYFLADQPFVVSGSQPFGVAQFHLSTQLNSGIAGGGPGDPAMVLLPAAEQLLEEYVFFTPPTYAQDLVTVARPVGSTTQLDGVEFTDVPAPIGTLDGVAFEAVHLPVEPGSHRIRGSEPFSIQVYGYAATASYAYPGGSGTEIIEVPPPPPEG